MAGAIIDVTSTNWGTPFDFYARLEMMYGKFDLDAAADKNWTMCSNFITSEQDALKIPWIGKNIYLNPPYGNQIPPFLEKILKELQDDYNRQIICLLPAKTDTKWFHEKCMVWADEIIFVQGRLKFRLPDLIGPDGEIIKKKTTVATFPSMVVQFTNQNRFNSPKIGTMRNR